MEKHHCPYFYYSYVMMKGVMMSKQETTELIKIVKELCCLLMNATNNPTKFRLILWILEQQWITPRLYFSIINRR